MASIHELNFRAGKASRYVEYFELDVTVDLEPHEPEYTLRGYVAEQDGSRDAYHVAADGTLVQEQRGNKDDWLTELWTLSIPAGTTGRNTYHLGRVERDVSYQDINSRSGDFYPIATLVPRNRPQISIGSSIPVRVTG